MAQSVFTSDGGGMFAQMGMQYGQKMLQESEKNLTRYLPLGQLRSYFRVSNNYVQRKLAKVIFPMFGTFQRQFSYDEDNPEYFPPIDDVNAPDLYIPLMAMITYVTLTGFVVGNRGAGKFSPELLGETSSKVMMWLLLEVGCIKLTRYITAIQTPMYTLDVLAWCGYKYCTICLIVVIRLILSLDSTLSTVITFFFSAMVAVFVFRSLREAVKHDGGIPKRAVPLLAGATVAQVPFCFWFSSRVFA
jgi:protein transport protein YIF1